MADQAAKVAATLLELETQHPDARTLVVELRKRLQPILNKVRAPEVNRPLEEWSRAFRDAARRDLDAVVVLANSDGDHAAAIAMLLQMVFEKIAKAYLAETDRDAFVKHRRSHAVAQQFIRIIRRDTSRRLIPQVGPHSDQVLLWIAALTQAHPALAKHGPHLEYPWENAERVCTPATDLVIVNQIRDAKSTIAPHLTRFASWLVDQPFDLTG